jgi:hypothetical protein
LCLIPLDAAECVSLSSTLFCDTECRTTTFVVRNVLPRALLREMLLSRLDTCLDSLPNQSFRISCQRNFAIFSTSNTKLELLCVWLLFNQVDATGRSQTHNNSNSILKHHSNTTTSSFSACDSSKFFTSCSKKFSYLIC